MRRYNETAVEWAMKVQEIILRAIAKKITLLLCAVSAYSASLERQEKPGRSSVLKGVHLVNCPFNK